MTVDVAKQLGEQLYETAYFQMVYQDEYHRCIFKIDRTWKKMFYSLVPFVAIIIMYTVMLIFLRKAKVESRKFLFTSFLIIATGVLAYLPDQLLIAFKVCDTNINLLELSYHYWARTFLDHSQSISHVT